MSCPSLEDKVVEAVPAARSAGEVPHELPCAPEDAAPEPGLLSQTAGLRAKHVRDAA